MSIRNEVQKLEPSAKIRLFELDASSITGDVEILRFHPYNQEEPIYWQGNEYVPFPVMIEGLEKTGDRPPSPVVSVGNLGGMITQMCLVADDLIGAKLIVRTTLKRFLDAENFPTDGMGGGGEGGGSAMSSILAIEDLIPNGTFDSYLDPAFNLYGNAGYDSEANLVYFSPEAGSPGDQLLFDPTKMNPAAVLSHGNAQLNSPAADYNNYCARSNNFISGMKYFSAELSGHVDCSGVGVVNTSWGYTSSADYVGDDSNSIGVFTGGNIYKGGSVIATIPDLDTSGVIEFAVDGSSSPKKVWIRKAGGSWVGGGDPTAGTSPTATLSGSGCYAAGSVYVPISIVSTYVRFHQYGEVSGEPPVGYGLMVTESTDGADAFLQFPFFGTDGVEYTLSFDAKDGQIASSVSTTDEDIILAEEIHSLGPEWSTHTRTFTGTGEDMILQFRANGAWGLTNLDNLSLTFEDEDGGGEPTDPGITPDPTEHFPDEIWFIDRKEHEDHMMVKWRLSSAMDFNGISLPRRIITANQCWWKYRGPECGYAGPPVAKYDDTPTEDEELDSCSRKISGCKLRFGELSELPYGSYPSAGLIR